MCLVAHHEQETNWDSGGIHISGAQCQQVQKLVDKVAMRTHFHRGGWELWCDIALILLPFWGINTSCIMSHRYIHSTRESISLVLKYLIWKTFDLIIIWIFYKLKACISIPSRFVLFFFCLSTGLPEVSHQHMCAMLSRSGKGEENTRKTKERRWATKDGRILWHKTSWV